MIDCRAYSKRHKSGIAEAIFVDGMKQNDDAESLANTPKFQQATKAQHQRKCNPLDILLICYQKEINAFFLLFYL